MKNLERYMPQMNAIDYGRNKVKKESVQKHHRTNLEKITIAIATATAIASITYAGYCLYENSEKDINNDIVASDLGYPEAIPCPAPSDPRVKSDIQTREVVAVKPVSNIIATPCPTPSETSSLG